MVATDIREQRPSHPAAAGGRRRPRDRRGGVRATLEPAHRLGVRALRGERALPTGDARRPERGSQCVGTKGPGRLQRLPRHVTDRLPASRGASRGATRASRCTNRARRSDPRRIRLRLLAPRSVCGPVPSAVRRVAEHHARARQGRGRIGSWLHHGPDASGPGRATVLDRYEGRPPAEPRVPLSRTLPCHSLRRVAPYESRIGG